MKDEKKLNFWKKLKFSITDFEKYQELAAESIGRTLGYIAILMIVFNIIVAGIYTYKFTKTIANTRQYILENIEIVTFEDNKLNIIPKNKEEITKLEPNEHFAAKVIIATQIDDENKIQDIINELNSENNGILILKDRILIKNEIISSPYVYKYETIAQKYNINHIDKEEVLHLLSFDVIKPLIFAFFGVMFIYMFMVYISSVLVDIIIFSVLGYIVTFITKMRIKYSALYNIAAYALTLPIILNLIYFIVNSFTGFTIAYFQIMYTAVASIYIITAILMIKSDVIKKQIELTKIIQEQDRVREEIKRREKEEQEEQERQKREEKEKEEETGDENQEHKKKKSKNNEPDINIGKEPEGNNV